MSSKRSRDISLDLTAFYMKIVGFWLAENYMEERRRKFAMVYTVCALSLAVWVEARDFYFSWGDYSNSIYIACNIASIAIGLFKMLISFVYKTELLNLVLYAKKNIWHSNYDDNEQAIADTCKRTSTLLICIFTFFAQGTVVLYIVRPILENIGKNESERILPFNMWLDLPLSMTPYFEIMFVIQVLSLYHVGVCYLCFDNFLCILNLHTAGQFRMLHYRLRTLCSANDCGKNYEVMTEVKSCTDKYYKTFRNYVQQHQALIDYCKRLEEVFTLIVLAQVLLFSLLICLDGYLVLTEDATTTLRLNFTVHIIGCMVQLLMFTYSCDSLIRESLNVADAAYESHWTHLPMDQAGRMVRRDLTLVIMRSQLPCCLTAGGFFAVSLETYTTVLSTAVSYFTLLKQY